MQTNDKSFPEDLLEMQVKVYIVLFSQIFVRFFVSNLKVEHQIDVAIEHVYYIIL